MVHPAGLFGTKSLILVSLRTAFGVRSQKLATELTVRPSPNVCTKKTPRQARFYGASGGIRTHDLCLRRATLYPTELRMHKMNIPLYTLFFEKSNSFYKKLVTQSVWMLVRG